MADTWCCTPESARLPQQCNGDLADDTAHAVKTETNTQLFEIRETKILQMERIRISNGAKWHASKRDLV